MQRGGGKTGGVASSEIGSGVNRAKSNEQSGNLFTLKSDSPPVVPYNTPVTFSVEPSGKLTLAPGYEIRVVWIYVSYEDDKTTYLAFPDEAVGLQESYKITLEPGKYAIRVNCYLTNSQTSYDINNLEPIDTLQIPLTVTSKGVPPSQAELREAFVILKQAESSENRPSQRNITWARNKVKSVKNNDGTSRYLVDRDTSQISFNQSNGEQIKVVSIEDFILFVEAVENQYSGASPGDVASEIREMWFSEENWRLLSGGQGISELINAAGWNEYRPVDIETKPNPIAETFDTQGALRGAPRVPPRPKLIQTRMGVVDIAHVISGIDVAINGMARYASSPQARLKLSVLQEASGGNTLDFATWSGDLGQAYGDYLRRRYVLGEAGFSLKEAFEEKSNTEALLADIHGYIATKVSEEMQKNGHTPTKNKRQKVSDIVRNLYLVEQPNNRKSYRYYFEQVAGESGRDLYGFIQDRTLRFAKSWYAKDVLKNLEDADKDERRRILRRSPGVRTLGIGDNLGAFLGSPKGFREVWEGLMNDFNVKHEGNQENAEPNNKLAGFIKSFIQMLDSGAIL